MPRRFLHPPTHPMSCEQNSSPRAGNKIALKLTKELIGDMLGLMCSVRLDFSDFFILFFPPPQKNLLFLGGDLFYSSFTQKWKRVVSLFLVTYRRFLPSTAHLRFVMAGGKNRRKKEEKRFSDLVWMLLDYCNKQGAKIFFICDVSKLQSLFFCLFLCFLCFCCFLY